MRIALWHNLPSGGAKRVLVDHAAGLAARGHHLEIWTNPAAAAQPPFFGPELVEHHVPLDIDTQRGGALPPWPIVRSRLAAMDTHLDTVAAQIAGGGFDVLYGSGCRFLRTVDLGSRLALPSLLYVQEPYRWLYEAMPTWPWAAPRRADEETWLRWARRRARDAATIPGMRRQSAAEAHAARGWDRLLVNSAYSRESVQRAYGLDARLCLLGTDPTRLAVTEPRPREGFVLGLGALVTEKGVARAVRAVAALPVPRPRLVWVANVDSVAFRAEIGALCRELAVDFDLRVGVSDEELADLLARAGVLIYTPHLEPFGLAAIEAASAGLPVVGLAEAGVRETVAHDVTGLLADDESELPDLLARVLNDRELAGRLSAAGPGQVAARWSLEGAVDRIEAHLLAVTGGR